MDRVPVALWRHFPVDDQRPADLAAATIEWQNQYDFDFVKVTPASSFCLKDWGMQDAWTGNPEGTRDYTNRLIHSPEDWSSLNVLDPSQGHLAAQLEALRLIGAGLGGGTPFIQTIFSPLSQARNLVGAANLPVHVRQHPKEVKAALDIITQTTVAFVQAARSTGIDGIFFALQLATTRVFSGAEYHEFGEPYDRRILDAAGDLWLNLTHLHGDDVMFELAVAYGTPVVNWHDLETPPTLAEGLARVRSAVCGGLRQWDTMVRGTPEQVRAEALAALDDQGLAG
jgi:uroporphyrinogen decarboxylase